MTPATKTLLCSVLLLTALPLRAQQSSSDSVPPAEAEPVVAAEPSTEAATPPADMAAPSDDRLAAAQAAVDAGDLPQAIELYEELLGAADPTTESLAMGKLALVLGWQSKFDDSAAMYDRWRKKYPAAERDATYGRAQVLGWGRRYGEALAEIDQLEKSHPWDRDVRYLGAQVAAWGGRYDRAVGAFRDILAHDPGDRDAHLGLAKVLSWAGRYPAADREYRAILDKEPEWTEALVGLSNNLAWSGRPGDAEKMLARVPADKRSTVEVRLADAALEWNLHEWGDSRRDLRRLITAFPGNTDAVDLWRSQSSVVGPNIEPYSSRVDAGDSLHDQRVGVRGAVPINFPSWAFFDGWSENVQLLGEQAEARGFRLGAGYSGDRRWSARAWGGYRNALGMDAGGATAGVEGAWSPRPNLGLVANAQRDYLFVTPQAMQLDMHVDGVTLGGYRADPMHSHLDFSVSHARYTGRGIEQTRDEVAGAMTHYVGAVKTLRLDAGVRGRWFGFDHSIAESGYFNPGDFREAMATLMGTWRRGEKLGITVDGAVGKQQIDHGTWQNGWALGTEVLYQLTRRLDLAAHLTYSRLNVVTGTYYDYTTQVGLKAHVGGIPR